MTSSALLPWLGLAGLGALHGINPGMGWLFAVALGLQERKGSAVWRALFPLALGHGLAIGAVVAVAVAVGLVVPPGALKWGVAGLLLLLGGYRLVRHGHPRYGGMQVGGVQLTIWSFLMATAHGAGLMVLPIVLGMRGGSHHGPEPSGHGAHLEALESGFGPSDWGALQVTLVHTLGYLMVTGLVALVVYRKLGLRLLRTAWINLDLIWAGALILTALATPFF